MSFREQIKELNSSIIQFEEKRIQKLDSGVYDKFAFDVCAVAESEMKDKIFRKHFVL